MRVILLSAAFLAFGCGLIKIRERPTSLKILCAYLGLTAVSELAAFYMARAYSNNMPVFHVLSPLLFVLLSGYFEAVSATVRKFHLGFWSSLLCIIIAVINTALFQPLTTMNSNYLLLEGLFGCILAFITLYDFLNDEDDIFIFRSAHFWITAVVLFHYLGTYTAYLALRLIKIRGANASLDLIYTGLWLLSVVNYLALGIIYLLYNRKWQPHD